MWACLMLSSEPQLHGAAHTHSYQRYFVPMRACRALIGAALGHSAASAALVHLLPVGPSRKAQQISNVPQLCRLLAEPELAGAVMAQHAELAEELVTGLAAAMEDAADLQATQVRQSGSHALWLLRVAALLSKGGIAATACNAPCGFLSPSCITLAFLAVILFTGSEQT